MVKTVVTDFVFDDHILRLEERDLIKVVKHNKRINSPIQTVEEYNREFESFRQFFENLSVQEYCVAKYVISESAFQRHNVIIQASNYEQFNINGSTMFEKDGEGKSTHIPVTKGNNIFEIKIPSHPQTVEIDDVGKLSIDYTFKTEFSLGNSWKGKPVNFTKKVNKDYASSIFSVFSDEKLFFGEPGRVYFRPNDAIHEELREALLFKSEGRFHMDGKIYIDDDFLYQGTINPRGTFPFFLRGNDENDEKRNPPKRPKNTGQLQTLVG